MNEYTPGPWSIGNANIKDEAEVGIHGPGEYGLIICDLQSDGYDEKTQKANAALIAAAPDLLEALENLLAVADQYDLPLSDPERIAARAAIAKARSAS